jgi:hypothetical protein
LKLFQSLSDEGVPLILFTNRELEPYQPYGDDGAGNLPVQHPMTLEHMVRNSEYRYLSSSNSGAGPERTKWKRSPTR